jgi:dTDP-4-amino-4,6-dideoxygalactose transaminase
MGGYSLNYHKHIHSGEGGFALTNSLDFANRMRLIRNHSESVVSIDNSGEMKRMLGNNFRLGEIEAAIAKPQVERIEKIVEGRIRAAHKLIDGLKELPNLTVPQKLSDSSNVFYILPLIFNAGGSITRDKLVEILRSEGIPGIVSKYTNIHRLPVFLEAKQAPDEFHPWNLNSQSIAFGTYGSGACPIAEDLYDNSFLGIHMCSSEFTDSEVELVLGAFRKVWAELGWTGEN